MLKRQYSLDKGDDPTQDKSHTASNSRVHKQNSAGAAHDLEKIEEMPLMQVSIPSPFRKSDISSHNCQVTMSIDNLNSQ